MSTREILSKAVDGMKDTDTVFINARNLREVAIEPGASIPADRPCAVKVGFLREQLGKVVHIVVESGTVVESNDPPVVAEAATGIEDDDLQDTAEFENK